MNSFFLKEWAGMEGIMVGIMGGIMAVMESMVAVRRRITVARKNNREGLIVPQLYG